MVATKFIAHTFTKSILQCFCTNCQVPNVEGKKIVPPPRTTSAAVVRRPPKKVAFLATEVRCSEQSKGGIKYELVLSGPAAHAESPKHAPSSPPRSNLSLEVIEEKLRKAQERRQSVEVQKLSFVTEKLNHLETVNRKREESEQQFVQTARESLELKLEAMKENRDSHIKGIQEKARDAVTKVEEKRKGGGGDSSPDKEERLEAIRRKLETAQEQREAHLNSLIHKLKEHDQHIVEVKRQTEDQKQTEALLEKSVRKLEIAEAKRNAMLREIQDKMREHSSHILKVRQFNETNQGEERLSLIQQKLNSAERKRTIQFQAMFEKLQEHERHSDLVRQKAHSVSEEQAKGNLSG